MERATLHTQRQDKFLNLYHHGRERQKQQTSCPSHSGYKTRQQMSFKFAVPHLRPRRSLGRSSPRPPDTAEAAFSSISELDRVSSTFDCALHILCRFGAWRATARETRRQNSLKEGNVWASFVPEAGGDEERPYRERKG
ncbi:hypothetical protein DACRYDRAFT_22042 [Dacryopinax primogenitus]|uniref:Uncharacterized protein n=1 Tax=Dacryopinax primogenitus (strain DJM 731) TaxID=1858805 RepID=M5G0V9_DACPD|nr:uncharacterized protein DACRYDRAFT_22042 [Dacryopinax primogenitus]EJU02379.1 hypothetical protein DACRYDRAFT_22042 [Dacryopinax primogenitus]